MVEYPCYFCAYIHVIIVADVHQSTRRVGMNLYWKSDMRITE